MLTILVLDAVRPGFFLHLMGSILHSPSFYAILTQAFQPRETLMRLPAANAEEAKTAARPGLTTAHIG